MKRKIIAHSVKVGNPYYIGHMTSAIPYFMILLEMIIAALNQNQVKIEIREGVVIRGAGAHRLDAPPDLQQGQQASTSPHAEQEFRPGQRHHRRDHREPDGADGGPEQGVPARRGVSRASARLGSTRPCSITATAAVIMVSKRGHYSIDKVARLIGLGERQCH